MAAIYISDLDNRIVDAIAEADFDSRNECQESARRQTYVHNMVMEAFQTIAGDDKTVKGSDVWSTLMTLADRASIGWVQKFSSRAERRIVLRRIFSHAEPLIVRIPVNEPVFPGKAEYMDYYNEKLIETIDFSGSINPIGSGTGKLKMVDPVTLQKAADAVSKILKKYKNNP